MLRPIITYAAMRQSISTLGAYSISISITGVDGRILSFIDTISKDAHVCLSIRLLPP